LPAISSSACGRLVGGEEGVALAHLLLQPLVQRAQFGALRRRWRLRATCRRRRSPAGQQVVDLRHVVARHLGDVGAAAHLHRHQAFDGQHLQRLAQRRAADAVLGASFISSIQLPGSSSRLKICWRRRSATSWYRARGARGRGGCVGEGHGVDGARADAGRFEAGCSCWF
jgi:hypothetical protein